MLRQFPTRYVIGAMIFVANMVAYSVRSSFSLNLLAMVNEYDENGTRLELPDHGPRYDWSAYEQGLLLGAFYYAYPVAGIPCGLLIDRFQIGRQFVGACFVLAALMCALSPVASSMGTFAWLFVARLTVGVSQGGNVAYAHRLISRWAPRSELGRFTFTIIGGNVGTIVAWTVCGPIIERFGWQWSFYASAIIVLVFVGCWWYAMYDTPELHPRVSEEERRFIEDNLQQSAGEQRWPPIMRMVACKAFWALLCLQFATDWGLYFVMTGSPKFLNQVLGFKISSTGILAALPYMFRVFTAFLFGYFGDRIRARGFVSLTNFRKISSFISHIIPGLFLLAIPFAGNGRPYVCIALMVLSMAFNGAVTQSSLGNYHDLAPSMAASTNAIINSVAGTSGFISPLVVAYFTKERNTILEWRYVFVTGASVYMLSAFVFIVLGSATDQKWSEKRSIRSDDQRAEA